MLRVWFFTKTTQNVIYYFTIKTAAVDVNYRYYIVRKRAWNLFGRSVVFGRNRTVRKRLRKVIIHYNILHHT